jgi:ParB family chromosome partitioning protein
MASKLKGLDVKHGDLYSVFPEALVMITDKADPLFDERINLPLKEETILNFMAMGVKTPLVVTRRGEQYCIVEGRQRYKHAVEANKRLKKLGEPLIRVPIQLERGDENSQMAVMVSLNELRQEDSMMNKIVKMKRMLDRGQTEEEVARIFGVSTTAIKQWRSIDDASPAVKKAIEKGQIAPSAAAKLSKLDPEKQKEALAAAVEQTKPGKKASVKAVAKAVKKKTGDVDEGAFISIKLAKKIMDALEAKGVDCSKEEWHFYEGLKFCTGKVHAGELCFVSPTVREACGLDEEELK